MYIELNECNYVDVSPLETDEIMEIAERFVECGAFVSAPLVITEESCYLTRLNGILMVVCGTVVHALGMEEVYPEDILYPDEEEDSDFLETGSICEAWTETGWEVVKIVAIDTDTDQWIMRFLDNEKHDMYRWTKNPDSFRPLPELEGVECDEGETEEEQLIGMSEEEQIRLLSDWFAALAYRY